MVYFIIEDKGGNGLHKLISFITEYKDILLFKEKVGIESVKGFGNFKAKIESIDFNKHKNDIFIVFMDRVYDNDTILEKYNSIDEILENFDNAFLSDILCFEYLLLTFNKFEDWIINNKTVDKLKDELLCRKELIRCVESGEFWYNSEFLINMINKECDNKKGGKLHSSNSDTDYILRNNNGKMELGYINEINKFIVVRVISLEVVSNILLRNLTSKSPFKASKKVLSECWTSKCYDRESDINCIRGQYGMHVCNLVNNKLTARNKANILYSGTYIGQICSDASEELYKINRRNKQ